MVRNPALGKRDEPRAAAGRGDEGGDTVAAAIRRFRLDRCREELEDRRQRARSITEIAFRWGFNDSAHFSRVFKARFGMSPRAVRRRND